ncbi:polysaccharide biosynthesis protein [Mesonia aquimarina]|uniref:hypothetical protein n=1 Tax=Mesonia aquimarina TaxID=1504967 RepID=UPI000EF5A005|nr:hypothetical protein [Mesonia aquimarina]
MTQFLKQKLNLLTSSPSFWFTILKYLEVAITTITTFLIASKVGPSEMGKAIPILLYVTYANYLTLGVNQVIIKNYSRLKENGNILSFITINFQYILVVCLLNFLLSFLVIDSRFFFFTALVSSAILLRSFFATYFRVINNIRILNKNNLIYSFILMILVYFFVENWFAYMVFWSFSMCFCVMLYFVDSFSFFKNIIKNILKKPKKNTLLFSISEGVKLALIGGFTTLVLTSDRFVINRIDAPLELKGSYQLADYVGMAIYIGITTVVFYFYPQYIERIRNDINFRKRLGKILKLALLLILPFISLVYLVSSFVTLFIFKDYENLAIYISLNCYIKLLVILLSTYGMLYIGLDKEKDFLKSLIPLTVIILAVVITIILMNDIELFYIPMCISFLLTLEVIRKTLFVNKTLIGSYE